MGNNRIHKGSVTAILSNQGFGTKKECARMIWAGLVQKKYSLTTEAIWEEVRSPDEPIELKDLQMRVNGIAVPYLEKIYLAFHKPISTECSHTPSHYQSIFAYFPEPFLTRGLEAVGRLDADTTGLLLLSDSGQFNHFFTSPKKHVSKTYRVGLKHPISEEQIRKISEGVQLKSEEGLTLPATIVKLGERQCDLTLAEGKYHQVKRMFAAVGNRVENIHRIAIGSFQLPENLPIGTWKILTELELKLLGFST